jgi:flavin-dependent dehydrogenase
VIVLDKARFPRDKPCGEGLMPTGAAVLEALGVRLGEAGFPPLRGVRYRTRDADLSAQASFQPCHDRPAYGVRRLRLDELLATRAAAEPSLSLELGCRVLGISPMRESVLVDTSHGRLAARVVLGCDGARSAVSRSLGWSRAPSARRYGVVGHLEVPRHGWDEIVVTLLEQVEVYAAPTGPDELLAVVLGGKGSLKSPRSSVADTYRKAIDEAMPELGGAAFGSLVGAGPFGIRPTHVAKDNVFLLGDAAGFIDPITGDALAAGLLAAVKVAELLLKRPADAAARYSSWEAGRWRRRRALGAIALGLCSRPAAARRALRALRRRPATLEKLVAVNSGAARFRELSPRDWAALAGA